MVSDKIVANAVGGKTARACDSCIRKRARWYCAADDAFLCQACDALVHSANPLARRHERVRLKTASFKVSGEASAENSGPSWHRGFTRKARTPRHGKQAPPKSEEQIRNQNSNPFPVVPEVGSDEYSNEENEEQLLYRVPIFDPFVGELCTSASSEAPGHLGNGVDESKAVLGGCGGQGVDYLPGFLPSEMDLAEFAADVESLLGRGLENQSFGMEELGLNLIDCRDKEVKIEEEEDRSAEVVVAACHGDAEIDMMREPFELSFDYDSPATCGEDEEKLAAAAVMKINGGGDEEQDDGKKKKKMKLLRLDYEGVITAWESQGISWFSGDRPEFDPSGCWPDCMGACGTEVHHHPYGDLGGMAAHPTLGNGEREARVLRYREKRRTRLFSKKIRYEVRKLNAEKRPRMKGRFVKRASFAGPGFPVHNK